MLFPSWFFAALVWGGMGLVSTTIVILLAMLAKDWKDGKLW